MTKASLPGRGRVEALAWALAAAFVLVLPDLLMAGYRGFYRRHFPDYAASWTLGGRYTAISPFDDPDANVYASRARSSADDPAADAYVKGRRARRILMLDTISFSFVGAIQRLTGDMSRTWLIARFIGAFLWALGLWWLMTALSGNPRYSAFAAVLLTLFADVYFDLARPIMLEGTARALLLGLRDAVIHSLWLLGGRYQYNFGVSRLLNPCLTFPPLFLALWLTLRAEKGGWGRVALSGVAGAALAHVHPDVWSIYVGGTGLWALLTWTSRRRFPRELAASLALTGLLSLPWFLTVYPLPPDILSRQSGILSHAFSPQGLPYLALFAWAAWRGRRDPALLYTACVVGAVGCVFEAQIVTGFYVTQGRWHFTGAVFAAALLLGLLGRRARQAPEWRWACVAVCALAAGRELAYASLRYPYQGFPRDVDAALTWLDKNAAPGAAVAVVAPQEAMLIPIYTRQKIVAPSGFLLACDLSTREVLQRIRLAESVLRVPEEALYARLKARVENPSAIPAWDQALWEGRVDWQDREWDNFVYFYAQVMPPRAFVDQLGKLRGEALPQADVDYRMVTPFERALLPKGAEARMGPPLFSSGGISIYGPTDPAATPSRRARR